MISSEDELDNNEEEEEDENSKTSEEVDITHSFSLRNKSKIKKIIYYIYYLLYFNTFHRTFILHKTKIRP